MFLMSSAVSWIRRPWLVLGLLLPMGGQAATYVQMQTSLGNITIELFDQTAPLTVANFLSYVNSGAYNNSLVHRSVPGFVIQGGGYGLNTSNNSIYTITTAPSVQNEFGASNVRGTIAMAKTAGNPNSAKDQWFINLADNGGAPNSLDSANGGYTVFGQVIENGMVAVDRIASMPVWNVTPVLPAFPFDEIPLIPPVTPPNLFVSNLVLIQSVKVVPVPAALWLFVSGILGVLGWVKRPNRV